MSGETSTEESTVVTEPSNEAAEAAQITSLQNDVAELKAQLDKQVPIMEKLRDHEQSSLRREKEALANQDKKIREGVEGELDALEQKFNKQLDDVKIDAALDKELTQAGARNVDIAKRLMDKQDITIVNGKADVSVIQSIIETLKTNESYLFKGDAETETTLQKKPAATPVARAGEPENEDIVNKELKAATSIADLNKIIDKHNIRQ